MNTRKWFEVVNGPSRDRLVDAFKYAYSRQARVPAVFEVALDRIAPESNPGHTYVMMQVKDFRILSLQHEDGSGHSFNIEGYCKASLQGGKNSLTEHRYKMYYNAKTRKGTITFETK